MKKIVTVPRLVDEENRNAQNLNAKELLSRFTGHKVRYKTFCYQAPDQRVLANEIVEIRKLRRTRLWHMEMATACLSDCQAIFYPGITLVDRLMLKTVKCLRGRTKVVSTVEGLIGNAERERCYGLIAGRKVLCAKVSNAQLATYDAIMKMSDVVIAISPFLAAMTSEFYKKEVQVLSLGVSDYFFSQCQSSVKPSNDVTVVCAGTLSARKRPEMFLQLAKNIPACKFVWVGSGALRNKIEQLAITEKVPNFSIIEECSQQTLASILAHADILALPSLSEGVPKITQEAATIGLPSVVFGHYQTPSVVDGQNGIVVWTDNEFIEAVRHLAGSESERKKLGLAAKRMAKQWRWDTIAPLWENAIAP